MSQVSTVAVGRSSFGSVEVAAQPSPDGLVDITAFSWSLNSRADVTVFAPSGSAGGADLPLVTLLHGVYSSHWAWARSGLAHTTLQRLVDEGRIRPMVLAMPSDGLIGTGSGYTARQGADAQAWVVDEVPDLVRLVHPRTGEGAMAIAGLSMGGWGALRLAARRPGRYQAAAGLSPLTRWDQVTGYAPERLQPSYEDTIDDPDLTTLLLDRRADLPPLRITCGVDDPLVDDVRTLHAALGAAGVEHEYAESEGGHEWSVWVRELERSLLFIDGVL